MLVAEAFYQARRSEVVGDVESWPVACGNRPCFTGRNRSARLV